MIKVFILKLILKLDDERAAFLYHFLCNIFHENWYD